MIRAIEDGRPHKADGKLAYHVTDVIFSMDEAIRTGMTVGIESTAEKVEGLWTTPETIMWK